MRTVDLTRPIRRERGQEERVARLTRHLQARLLDFGPGGPEVVDWSQEEGVISTRFPGRSTSRVLEGLRHLGIQVEQEGELAVFYLHQETEFEDLDYVWGSLFQCLDEEDCGN